MQQGNSRFWSDNLNSSELKIEIWSSELKIEIWLILLSYIQWGHVNQDALIIFLTTFLEKKIYEDLSLYACTLTVYPYYEPVLTYCIHNTMNRSWVSMRTQLHTYLCNFAELKKISHEFEPRNLAVWSLMPNRLSYAGP
jgi:hypothetical protein